MYKPISYTHNNVNVDTIKPFKDCVNFFKGIVHSLYLSLSNSTTVQSSEFKAILYAPKS